MIEMAKRLQIEEEQRILEENAEKVAFIALDLLEDKKGKREK